MTLPDPLPDSYASAAWFDSAARIPRDLLDQIKPDTSDETLAVFAAEADARRHGDGLEPTKDTAEYLNEIRSWTRRQETQYGERVWPEWAWELGLQADGGEWDTGDDPTDDLTFDGWGPDDIGAEEPEPTDEGDQP